MTPQIRRYDKAVKSQVNNKHPIFRYIDGYGNELVIGDWLLVIGY